MFQCVRDKKGLLTLTSTIMEAMHLPELELKGIYPNQREAAQKFMGAAQQQLVSHLRHLKEEDSKKPLKALLKDMDLELTPEQAAKAEAARTAKNFAPRGKRKNEVSTEPLEAGPCRVHLKLRGSLSSEESAITINPPADQKGRVGDWLRQACRRIGIDCPEPVAPTQEAADAAMLKAVTRVRHELPYIREQFLKGFPGDARLSIHAAVTEGKKGKKSYQWLTVTSWPSDPQFVGVPEDDEDDSGSGARTATEIRVQLEDVCDYMLGGEDVGFLSGLYLQRVQEEYGELAHL